MLALAALSLGGPGLSAAAQSLQATATLSYAFVDSTRPTPCTGATDRTLNVTVVTPGAASRVTGGSGRTGEWRVATRAWRKPTRLHSRPGATSALLSTSRARTRPGLSTTDPDRCARHLPPARRRELRAHQSALSERLGRQPAVRPPRSGTCGPGGYVERRGHRPVVLQHVLLRRAYTCNGNHQRASRHRRRPDCRSRASTTGLGQSPRTSGADASTSLPPTSRPRPAYAQLDPPKAFVTDPTGTHDTPPTFPDGTADAFLDRFVAGDTSPATAAPFLGSRQRPILRLRPR